MAGSMQWRFERGHREVLAPGRFLWLRSIAWAAFLFLDMIFFFYASTRLSTWFGLSYRWEYLLAILIPILAFYAYSYVVGLCERRPATEIVFGKRSVLELLLGAAIGASLIASIVAAEWKLDYYHVEPGTWAHGFQVFVFESYISGLLEELAFRAIVLRLLSRTFGPVPGLLLSSALFGAAHMGHASPLNALAIACHAGLILGLLYMATGRLWMSVGVHIAFNFTESSIFGINHDAGLFHCTAVAGKSAILTGGSFGPDGSAVSILVGGVYVAAILFAHSRGVFRAKVFAPVRSPREMALVQNL